MHRDTYSAKRMTFQFCNSLCRHARLADMGAADMKDLYQVLRQKELDLERIRKEIEALRFVTPLLSEDTEADKSTRPAATPSQSRRTSSGD